MSDKKIQNNHIPVVLKIQKWDDVFYIVKNFYGNYQKEIFWYKIILSSDLKSDFHIDSNKTIKISNSFFEELKNDDNKIYLLENEISKFDYSKWLNLERFEKYIDNLKLDWKYCLLSDKLVFLVVKEEIKRDLEYIYFNDLKSSKGFFDIEYNISKDKNFNKIFNNKEKENQRYNEYITYKEKIKEIWIQIWKEKENKKKEELEKRKNEIKSKNQEFENIFTNIKKTLIEERENEYEKYSLKYFNLLEKLYFLLEDFRNKKLIINKEEKTFYEEFYLKQYISEIKNKEEIINLYTNTISFENFIESDWFIKIKEEFENNIKKIKDFLWLDEEYDVILNKIIEIYKTNFKNNLIKKVDYNYLQNYKKYLLEKYKESSPEIINFIQNIYYLPKEYWDKFDGIKDITFDESKFKTDNKLSLYWFQQKKWQEFDYIINQDIFWDDKKYTFNKVKKTKDNKIFQVLTLDKIIKSNKVFLIDENNKENNENLFKEFENSFENFHKDILPVFFVEWSSYYLLDKDFNKIDYYFIKYDTKIWNNTKYFSKVWELDFVIFPYKWLDWFVDQMIKWLNNNLKKDSWDFKTWKINWNIKQTNFYTNKTILKELDKILKKLRNNLNKTLEETQSEDYLYNIKQIDYRVLLDIATKVNYKPWDDLQEKLKEISVKSHIF